MTQTSLSYADQPILGDTGYALRVGDKLWQLGNDSTCDTVAGALAYWQARLTILDADIRGRHVNLADAADVMDEHSTVQSEQRSKIERELKFLDVRRAEMEATIEMLVQQCAGNC